MASTSEDSELSSQSDNDSEYIVLRDVKKTFNQGQVVACEDINISIGESEFIVLLGPSGCGKTTTLRSIAGLGEPDEGRIHLNGEDITNKRPKERNLAFVFQSIALFPHKTVRENIRFGLDMQTDLSKTKKQKKVNFAAEVLGIGDLLDRKPSELSGGQQQRVSLGRAMVMDPDAFLLDEPFAALDAKLKDTMETEVKELQRELETAMVFVTHDQKEAMTLGDRIIVMNDGKIQQIDKPYNIYNDPDDIFVSQFIGSPTTNTFDCTIQKSQGKTLVEHDLFTLNFSDSEPREPLSHGQEVELGIRPEHLNVDRGDGLFRADVTLIEPEGTNDVVHLKTGEYEFTAYPPQDHLSNTNITVSVEFDVNKAWLFGEGGERIV